MSRISVPKNTEGIDSIEDKKKELGDRRAIEVLQEAQAAWDSMYKFRMERDRNKKFVNGRQWEDLIKVDGKRMTEEEYIKKQGNMPLKNNIMQKLIRSVISAFRSQSKEPTCMARDRDEQQYGETMSTVLQYNMQLNQMKNIHAKSMKEFLISGMAVQRKWCGWQNGRYDCWTKDVQLNNFFIDPNMRDSRGWDASIIGEIHDVSFDNVCSEYARCPADVERLREIYDHSHEAEVMQMRYRQFGYDEMPISSFLLASDFTRCRVIEVWRKETKGRYRCHDYNSGDMYKIEADDVNELVVKENLRRRQQGLEAGMAEEDIPYISAEWFVDEYWYHYMLSPFGDILEEGETPYWHHSHPYVFVAYPFIDGEIHSFAADFIDQQKYINRLITMYDWIMRASAKGVLLFPEDCLPDGMDISDVADEWSRFNGVIAIKKGSQSLPQQVANNSTNIGITELLNIQLKLIEDISGVSGAMQGKAGYSGMSASLYAQQTQNSMTSLLDIFETYSEFVREGAIKDVKNMQQFYDEKMVFQIAGRSGRVVTYDPERMNNVDFDLSIVESAETPAYRTMANDILMKLFEANAISVKQLLEVGDFPFADKLLQNIKAQEEAAQQGQVPGGVSPEIIEQMRQNPQLQNADMDAVNKAYDMMKGAA